MGLTRLRLVIYSVRLQEAVGRSHATELQNRCRLGNLGQQSDKPKNKQPSSPFVQSSHPQLGADTNGQKSEHFRHGPRLLQRHCGTDPIERRASAAVGSGLISPILSPTPLRMDGKRRR
jgi:hypothetical protein